jgi:hypothetical protein
VELSRPMKATAELTGAQWGVTHVPKKVGNCVATSAPLPYTMEPWGGNDDVSRWKRTVPNSAFKGRVLVDAQDRKIRGPLIFKLGRVCFTPRALRSSDWTRQPKTVGRLNTCLSGDLEHRFCLGLKIYLMSPSQFPGFFLVPNTELCRNSNVKPNLQICRWSTREQEAEANQRSK